MNPKKVVVEEVQEGTALGNFGETRRLSQKRRDCNENLGKAPFHPLCFSMGYPTCPLFLFVPSFSRVYLGNGTRRLSSACIPTRQHGGVLAARWGIRTGRSPVALGFEPPHSHEDTQGWL